MAVEVYQSIYPANTSNQYHREGFELASFFSASANFTIIDSYSSVVGRHKLDPIAEPEWNDDSDVGGANDWFIIQSENSIHVGLPKWQAKIQWVNGTTFDDVSGLNYGYEGITQKLLLRFSPYGGWDLEDTNPDFNPIQYPGTISYRSGNNYEMYALASGADSRWIGIVDEGQFLRFSRKNATTYAPEYFSGFFGDITPVDATEQLMPRIAMPGYVSLTSGVQSNTILPEEGYTTGWHSTYGGMAFEDVNRDWVHTGYKLPTGQEMISYWTQPHSGSAAGVPQMDIIPYYALTSTHGMLGTIPMMGRALGIGFQPINNKNWLSLTHGYGVVFKWDGSTNLSF